MRTSTSKSRPSRRGVSRNKLFWDDYRNHPSRPSRRGVSRNQAYADYEQLVGGRPSRRGVSRNTGDVGFDIWDEQSPLPQGRE